MSDLDSLAGAVSYRHCLPQIDETHPNPAVAFHDASARAGLYLATASADRLDIFGRMNRENVKDLRFSGFVTWTGNSSMEVVVKMEGEGKGAEEDGWQTLMLGRFAMVCRDATTQKARKIPGLIVETEEEKALWSFGQGGLGVVDNLRRGAWNVKADRRTSKTTERVEDDGSRQSPSESIRNFGSTTSQQLAIFRRGERAARFDASSY